MEPAQFETRFPSDKPPHKPRHGTYSEYTNHRCRCGFCRAANTRYNLKRRVERQKRLLKREITVEHGKYSTYTNYGCRCDLCKRANAERVAASNGSTEDATTMDAPTST